MSISPPPPGNCPPQESVLFLYNPNTVFHNIAFRLRLMPLLQCSFVIFLRALMCAYCLRTHVLFPPALPEHFNCPLLPAGHQASSTLWACRTLPPPATWHLVTVPRPHLRTWPGIYRKRFGVEGRGGGGGGGPNPTPEGQSGSGVHTMPLLKACPTPPPHRG